MGQRVAGYEVVRELGRGGMGVVLAVRCPATGRELALKLLQKGLGADEVVRFRREAEALARVRHPGVVPVHAFEVGPGGEPVLVTELVPGVDLKTAAREALPPRRAAQLVRDLARAAAALHAQGVVHRDLKPSNVILRPDGRPVIIDFGLARVLDAASLTATGMVLGTPGFLAPEQALGLPVDARTDVYGLGAILFFLLARRAPFEGTALQVLRDVVERDPRWPSQDDRSVPRDLEAVVRRAMARDPADRPATAEALAGELDGWLAAGRRGAGGRGAWVAAAVAGCAVLALAGAVVHAARPSRPAPPPPTPVAPVRPATPPPLEPTSGPTSEERFELRLKARERGSRLAELEGEAGERRTRVRFVGQRELVVLREDRPEVVAWRLGTTPRPYLALPAPPAAACRVEAGLVVVTQRQMFTAPLPGPAATPTPWLDLSPDQGRGAEVVDVSSSPDGLVALGRRRGAELFDAAGVSLQVVAAQEPITCVAFAGPFVLAGTSRPGDVRARTRGRAAGQLLVLDAVRPGGVRIRDLGVGVAGVAGLRTDAALDALVATEDGSVLRFDLRRFAPQAQPERQYRVTADAGELGALALDPRGERFYTARRYRPAIVQGWRLADDERPAWTRSFGDRKVTDLAASFDGQLLAVAFLDGGVEVWSTPD